MECIEFLKRDVKDILLMFKRKFSKKKIATIALNLLWIVFKNFEERGNKVLL